MKKIELTNRKPLTEIQKLKIKNNALKNEIRLLKEQLLIQRVVKSLPLIEGKTKSNVKKYNGVGRQAPPPKSFDN